MAVSHILIVIIAAIALTIFAERRQIQAPLLLAAVGVAASFIPSLPTVELEPDVILGVVLPPLLYSAARDFSFFSFMRRLGEIVDLSVFLVAVTAVAVGFVVHSLLPGVSLPMALILGAAVAPPDAVSAVAIGSKLGLPRRLMTILKGESLVNDAAALTIFTLAVAAATGRHNFIGNSVLYFLYAVVVGVVIGIFIGVVIDNIRRRLENPTLISALAIIVPFAAYALAEELNASGVIAVVFAGFALGQNAENLGFAGRISEREVWRVIDGLLEMFVFAYMGLQFRSVVSAAEASGYSLGTLGLVAALLLVLVIVIRVAWVAGAAWRARSRYRRRLEWLERPRKPQPDVTTGRRRRPRRDRKPTEPISWRENVVLSWTGMRGVVTVAAAAGTPLLTEAGAPLMGREVVVPLAFAVAIGTLLLHGLTLPWLIRTLRISKDNDETFRRDQLKIARAVILKSTREVLDGLRETEGDAAFINRAQQLLEQTRLEPVVDGELNPAAEAARRLGTRRSIDVVLAILTARRKALIDERNKERLDDEILREILEDIDLQQAVIARRGEPAELSTPTEPEQPPPRTRRTGRGAKDKA